MVLCDGGFLLSTGVSMMMNGVCCVYQMNGEKDLRQAMRSDIREEWKQQRAEEARAKLEEERLAERLRLRALKQRHKLLNKANKQPKLNWPLGATFTFEDASITSQEKAASSSMVGGSSQPRQHNYHNRHTRDASLNKKMNEDCDITLPCLLDEEIEEDYSFEEANPQECCPC